MFLSNRNGFTGRVFGVTLAESLSVASAEVIVQSELVSFGRIPIVVAKCGAYLKANGLETSGIFRIAGNGKRVKPFNTYSRRHLIMVPNSTIGKHIQCTMLHRS